MARSGKGRKGRGRDSGDDWESNLIRALNHRVRRRILRFLQTSSEPSSPARIAKVLDESLSNVSYHVQVLVGFETAKKVDERQVRGSIEHFYVSTVEDDATIQTLLETTKGSDEV